MMRSELTGGRSRGRRKARDLAGSGVALAAALVVQGAAFAAVGPGRLSAARAGAEDAGDEGIARLVETARRGRRTSARLKAVKRLGATGEARAVREWRLVELMLELVKDPNPRIAWQAVIVLGDYATGADPATATRIRGPLVALARNPKAHPAVRLEAVKVLGLTTRGSSFEVGEVVGELVKLASTGPGVPPELAGEALKALARIGDARAAEPIRKGLFHGDPIVKEKALEALEIALRGPNAASFLAPRTGVLLLDLLRREDVAPEAKESVLRALANAVDAGHRAPGAEKAVVALLREEKLPSTAVAALEALGSVGTSKAAAPLREVYERFRPGKGGDGEGKAGVRASMKSSVRAQVCATAGDLIERWGSERSSVGCAAAARALLELLVSAVVDDGDAEVLAEAVIALGAFHAGRYDGMRPKAVEGLVSVVCDESLPDTARRAALDSLRFLTGRSFDDAERWRRWLREEMGIEL